MSWKDLPRALRRLTLAVLLTNSASYAVRTFEVVNGCPFTVWPALYTDLSVAPNLPNFPTGWRADPYTSVSFPVPDDWKSGRIWARRDCNFNIVNDASSCLSGGCNGGYACDVRTGTGVPPATLAEFTLSGDGNRDFYDVSLVNGYNIPMRIDASVACPSPDCPVDLGPACPPTLQGPYDTTGFPLGCKSACEVDSNPQNSPACCSGSYNTAVTCPPTGVPYYDYFKGNCPNAYAYAYDESSNSALWTCDSGLAANYTITFCPAVGATSSGSVSITSTLLATSGVATGHANTTTSSIPSSTSGSDTATGVASTAQALPSGAPTFFVSLLFCIAWYHIAWL